MVQCGIVFLLVFFFKQKTAYEMRISDWSSDVCSSDLQGTQAQFNLQKVYIKDASFEAPNSPAIFNEQTTPALQLNLAQNVSVLGEGVYEEIGRASCRERVCQYV